MLPMALATFFTDFFHHRRRRSLESALARGDTDAHRALAAGALASWDFNWEDGGRGSLLRDIERLHELSGHAARHESLRDLAAAFQIWADSAESILRDRANYLVDGRMVRPHAAAAWSSHHAELVDLRRRARASAR